MTQYVKGKVKPGHKIRYNSEDPTSVDRALDIIYKEGEIIDVRKEDVDGFKPNFIDFDYEKRERMEALMKEEDEEKDDEPNEEPKGRGTKEPKGGKKVK